VAHFNLALLLAYLLFSLSNGYLIVEVLDYSVLPCLVLMVQMHYENSTPLSGQKPIFSFKLIENETTVIKFSNSDKGRSCKDNSILGLKKFDVRLAYHNFKG